MCLHHFHRLLAAQMRPHLEQWEHEHAGHANGNGRANGNGHRPAEAAR
jgi:hypothetical protein